MRKFEGRTLSDADPGRDTLEDGSLGRPDEACGACAIVISLEVQARYQSLTGVAFSLTFDID